MLGRAQLRARDIAAIGITNQRETTVVWDRKTGKPICNAIVWQDRRTAEFCDRLKRGRARSVIRERTGLVIDAYFSGTKLAWILDNVAGARARAEAGKLAFGTVDTWLLWKLTSGATHITDVTNASRTMLFNIHTLHWDDELLRLLNVPRELLPEVRSSSEVYGERPTTLGSANVAVAGIAGDQQAALFGQMCFTPGLAKNTYGTGCFMLQNTGERPVVAHKLLTTVAWKRGRQDRVRARRQRLHRRRGGAMAARRPRHHQLVGRGRGAGRVGARQRRRLPGAGVCRARRAALGPVRARHDRRHHARHHAPPTSPARQLKASRSRSPTCSKRCGGDAGIALTELRVDGGAAANDLLMQFQADLLGVPVVRPEVTETTALGAAYLAGLAVGYWDSTEALAKHWRADKRFEPSMPAGQVAARRAEWREALNRSKNWIDTGTA